MSGEGERETKVALFYSTGAGPLLILRSIGVAPRGPLLTDGISDGHDNELCTFIFTAQS